ncbi:MAG: hypothetical protein ACUVWJ_04525 [Spirochaetota bacterium]
MIKEGRLNMESGDRVHSISSILVAILVFGSLWGLLEISLGGAMRMTDFPYRSALLTGLGMGFITGMALAIYRKPVMAFGVGGLAALTKLMVVPIQRVPISCPANSCLAVMLEASALGFVAFFMIKKLDRNPYAQIFTGVSAALTGSMLFWIAGMHVAPCKYLLSFSGAPVEWIYKEGLIWATFSGILFPAGYQAGVKLRSKVISILIERPRLSLAGSVALIMVSLTISAISLKIGL